MHMMETLPYLLTFSAMPKDSEEVKNAPVGYR